MFYDVPMAVLLGEVDTLSGPSRPPKITLDLEKLKAEPAAEAVWRYLQAIIRERGDYNGRVLSVRRDDARALCAVMHVDEPGFAAKLAEWGVLIED
jgi:hypothetical protein